MVLLNQANEEEEKREIEEGGAASFEEENPQIAALLQTVSSLQSSVAELATTVRQQQEELRQYNRLNRRSNQADMSPNSGIGDKSGHSSAIMEAIENDPYYIQAKEATNSPSDSRSNSPSNSATNSPTDSPTDSNSSTDSNVSDNSSQNLTPQASDFPPLASTDDRDNERDRTPLRSGSSMQRTASRLRTPQRRITRGSREFSQRGRDLLLVDVAEKGLSTSVQTVQSSSPEDSSNKALRAAIEEHRQRASFEKQAELEEHRQRTKRKECLEPAVLAVFVPLVLVVLLVLVFLIGWLSKRSRSFLSQ